MGDVKSITHIFYERMFYMKVKKLLCVLMSLLFVFSFSSLAFAQEEQTSKTEAFVQELQNGFGVKANLSVIDGLLYIKKDKAAANVSLGPLNAKAVLNDGKFTAYLSIFRADLNEVLPPYTIDEITGIVNEVTAAFSEFDTSEIFDYLDVIETKTVGGKFVEVFGPDYEAIAELIVEENPDALNEKDAEDIKAFCEYFAEGSEEVKTLLSSKASFTYEDEKAETLVEATVSVPDDKGVLQDVDIFDTLTKELGITVSFITVDVDDGVFKAPLAILNITWLIKLIMKLA